MNQTYGQETPPHAQDVNQRLGDQSSSASHKRKLRWETVHLPSGRRVDVCDMTIDDDDERAGGPHQEVGLSPASQLKLGLAPAAVKVERGSTFGAGMVAGTMPAENHQDQQVRAHNKCRVTYVRLLCLFDFCQICREGRGAFQWGFVKR